MAYFGRNEDTFNVKESLKIIKAEVIENYVVYIIKIEARSHWWTIRKRYSEFKELHDQLSPYAHKNVRFPPKKIYGNLSDSLINKRKILLEEYLQNLIKSLSVIPKCLRNFLNFDKFEIEGVTQKTSEQVYEMGDIMLKSNQVWQICPLLLHSVSCRRRLPVPKCNDCRSDMGHLMDFASKVEKIRVLGGITLFENSTIKEDEFIIDFSIFHNLKQLEIDTCKGRICGVDYLRNSLLSCICSRSISHLSDLIVSDSTSNLIWNNLIELTIKESLLARIDDSTKYLKNLKKLDLSYNRLTTIDNLHYLSALENLNLSHNKLNDLPINMRCLIGNVTILNLSDTGLKCLAPLSKLYGLKYLDVSDNIVARVDDVRPITSLPCLESLKLIRNPLTSELDYRFRLLEILHPRENEIKVDDILPSTQELDTVAVRLAMTRAKIAKQTSELNLLERERGIPDGADNVLSRKFPDVSDSNFVETILTRLPNTFADEILVSSVWSPVLLPTTPSDALPCVIAISTHCVHILRARSPLGSLCQLEHLLTVPLTKVSLSYRDKVWLLIYENEKPVIVVYNMIEDLINAIQAVKKEVIVNAINNAMLINAINENNSYPETNIYFKCAAKLNNSTSMYTIVLSKMHTIYSIAENFFSDKFTCRVNAIFSHKRGTKLKLFLSASDSGDNSLTNFCILVDNDSECVVHLRFVSYTERREFYKHFLAIDDTGHVYDMIESDSDGHLVDEEDNNDSNSDNDDADDDDEDDSFNSKQENVEETRQNEKVNDDENFDDSVNIGEINLSLRDNENINAVKELGAHIVGESDEQMNKDLTNYEEEIVSNNTYDMRKSTSIIVLDDDVIKTTNSVSSSEDEAEVSIYDRYD